MPSTNPKEILTTLHFIRAAIAGGLMSKDEVIDWADTIITKDDQPDIFFIDLALSSSKSSGEVLRYINDYLNFDTPFVQGRPLLGLLYKKWHNGQFDLEHAIRKMYQLKCEAIFNGREEGFIYSIEDEFVCAKHGIYGTIEDVQLDLERFLSYYKYYSIDNFEQWPELDKAVESKLEESYTLPLQQIDEHIATPKSYNKPWWRFW